MKIKRVSVKNFKCFDDVDIEIKDFNVVIGKNASGKSNFINIFKFVNDILMYGIDDAIAIQGGINYLCNALIGKTKNIELKFSVDISENHKINVPKRLPLNPGHLINTLGYDVEVHIKPNKKGNGYNIIKDLLRIKYSLQIQKEKSIEKTLNISDKTTIEFYHECVKTEKNSDYTEKFSEIIPEDIQRNLSIENQLMFHRLSNKQYELEQLLLINLLPYTLTHMYSRISNNNLVNIYDFDSKTLKMSSMIGQQNALNEDGSNISNILQKILRNSNEKKQLLLLLKDLLPFVSDIDVESNFNKSLYFRINENNSKTNLPSYLLSDGTVNLIAIIIVLYFQAHRNTIIIEEPEKNMHPKLAQRLVKMMKENSTDKQLIITTHSTHLLSAVELEDLIYVYRNNQGYSNVYKPNENKRIKEYIKNELEIEDLFFDSLFDNEGV